jgi:hypothetical protein
LLEGQARGAIGSLAQATKRTALGNADIPVILHDRRLEHDPEKWKPVFRKDHAQTKR